MIVVLDCNIIVSAGTKDGFVRHILGRIIEKHEIIVSAGILDEYERVARYPKFSSQASSSMLETIEAIEGCARFVDPSTCEFALPDPEDINYIEAAISGGADFLITGNAKHFPDGRYGVARVVTAREFAVLAGLIP